MQQSRMHVAWCMLCFLTVACANSLPVKAPDSVNADEEPSDSSTASIPTSIAVPTDDQLQQWFLVAKQRVQAETGADLGPVVLKHMTPPQMNLANQEAQALLYKGRPRQLSIVRALDRNRDGPEYRSVVAVFNPAQNAVIVTGSAMRSLFRTARDNDIGAEEAFITLMTHELVHASDRVLYSPGVYVEPSNVSSLAVRAIIEGHAQYLTAVICARENCQRGYRMLRDDIISGIGSASFLANPNAQYSAGVSEFTYFYGERFFSKLSAAPELIEQAMRNPPIDAVQIRFPEKFPDRSREQRSERLNAIFQDTPSPWDLDQVVVYRNRAFVPTSSFPRRQILAQEFFDIFVSEITEYATNVSLHWYSNPDKARAVYNATVSPTKNTRQQKRLYSEKTLDRQSDSYRTSSDKWGRLTVRKSEIVPTAAGLAIDIEARKEITTIGWVGKYIVQATQRSSEGAHADMSDYVKLLLAALAAE